MVEVEPTGAIALSRVDVIPSADWSAIAANGRLVHAAIDGNVIATFWESRYEDPETAGWHLVRTDTFPVWFGGGGVGGYYLDRNPGLPGAYAYVNSEVFLWLRPLRYATPQLGVTGAFEGLYMYPKNSDLTLPTP